MLVASSPCPLATTARSDLAARRMPSLARASVMGLAALLIRDGRGGG